MDTLRKTCDSCQSRGLQSENATMFCKVCNESYCDSCANYHKGFKFTRDHSLAKLLESQIIKVSIVDRDRANSDSHVDETRDSNFEGFVIKERVNEERKTTETSSDFDDGFIKLESTNAEAQTEQYIDRMSMKMAQVHVSSAVESSETSTIKPQSQYSENNTTKGNDSLEDQTSSFRGTHRYFPSNDRRHSTWDLPDDHHSWDEYHACHNNRRGPGYHHPPRHRWPGHFQPPHEDPLRPFGHPPPPFGHPPPPFGHPPPPFGHPPPSFGRPLPPGQPPPPPFRHPPTPFGRPPHRHRHHPPRHQHRLHPHFQTDHD